MKSVYSHCVFRGLSARIYPSMHGIFTHLWSKMKYFRFSKLLTGGNWQKWKIVFLTCPCHEIYRDEAVGLKSSKNTWKITIFVKMWNLGQNRENLILFNNCLIKAWILKILLHTCDTYNYDYLKYSTFSFNFIDFQLYIDFPFQFCVFYRKIT